MKKKRIESLKQFREMMDSGELPREHWKLCIDSGYMDVRYTGPIPAGLDHAAGYDWRREQEDKYEVIFNREDAFISALKMCNIPQHWV